MRKPLTVADSQAIKNLSSIETAVPFLDVSNNFFGQKAGTPKPDNPYYLGGGGFGGPIIKNRTFFWVAAEDYHDIQTRVENIVFPTAAERAGDFSGLTTPRAAP